MADIRAAAGVIRGQADNTPLIPSPYMSAQIGHDFLLKLEITQPMGAFKLRGALSALAALPPGTPGVVCCSTGNHGRALAYAARQRGLRAVVCMSALVPETKLQGILDLGAEVRIIGQSQDDAAVESRRLSLEEGLVEVPPFDHPHIIAGQGTIGLELLSARPDLTTILVPLSGGGLAAGIALAAKAIKPAVRVIGISMDRGAAMHASLAARRPVLVGEHASLADSLGGGIGLENRWTFTLCQALLDDVILVSEYEIHDAMQALYFQDRIVAEGGAVVGLAAILSGKLRPRGPTATILTGRNVDMGIFTALMAGQDVRLGDLVVQGKPHAP
jgi:threonine dehydratase